MTDTQPTDCIFCKIAAKEIPTDLIYEDDHVVAFNDLNPQAPVHVLVIPKKHLDRVNELPEADNEMMSHLIAAANKVARMTGIDEKGFRLVINSGDNGGQTVYHLHIHVLGERFMRWPPG